MTFKAIVVDIDGTITYSDRSIDCKAVAALRSLRVPVVIATGNVLCVARAVAKLLGTSGIVIAENGGVVECGKVESDTSHMKECLEALEVLKKLETRTINYIEEDTLLKSRFSAFSPFF